jgi:hypothetical protein
MRNHALIEVIPTYINDLERYPFWKQAYVHGGKKERLSSCVAVVSIFDFHLI